MGTEKSYREEIARLLTQPELPGQHYYHITLLADREGNLQWGVQTHWCGFTETTPRREIREGSFFPGEGQRSAMHEMGQPALLVNDIADYRIWLTFGGHALIVESVARDRLMRLIEPRVSARDTGGVGFRDIENLTEHQRQHAPSKKLRMEVLTRDGRRCVICGRSPAYYVDVELHVHHAVPWGNGGITEAENLITLCKTCHDGLDPHFDFELAMRLREKYQKPKPKYLEDIGNYQRWVREHLSKAT